MFAFTRQNNMTLEVARALICGIKEVEKGKYWIYLITTLHRNEIEKTLLRKDKNTQLKIANINWQNTKTLKSRGGIPGGKKKKAEGEPTYKYQKSKTDEMKVTLLAELWKSSA